jgi:hypothetical protein
MKRLLAITLLTIGSLSALTLGACGKKDGAPADMNATCYVAQTNNYSSATLAAQGTNCNYNYDATPGFTRYQGAAVGGYLSSSSGLGCSGIQSTVYSDSKGLGCVDSTYINMMGVPARYVLQANGTFTTVSVATPLPYSQYQNNFGGVGSGSGIGATVLRSCDGSEGCPGSQVCRAASPTSVNAYGLGICYLN